jgi:hypothetical protein
MTQPHQTLVPSPSDRIICFKVGKVKRENLYEMTRKYWKVNILRARNATHALAIVDGVVQAVYLPYRWYLTEDPMSLGRYEFDGEEDPDSDYIGQSVREFYGKSQNPIKYINL